MTQIDFAECLNCTLPVDVCCGIPLRCKARYERYLKKKEEAERKKNIPRKRRRKRSENYI